MMKRVLLVFIAVIVAFSGMLYIETSAQNDISISYQSNLGSINKGDQFNITFNLENISSSTITNVAYTISSNSSFNVISGDSSKSNAVFGTEYTLNLEYLGGSNNLPIKLSYKRDSTQINDTIDNITISQIEETSSSSGSSENEPKLMIESSSIPAATAGESMKIPITVTNDSRYTAKNITVKLSLPDSDNNPFEMESLNLTQSISTLSSKRSEGVIFNLKVKPYADEKTYELNVDFKYSNSRNSQFTCSEKIYVKVTNNKNAPVLVVDDIRCSVDSVKAGTKFQISLNVSNMGDLEARSVKLSVEGLKSDGFTLSSGVDSWYFDRVKGNEKRNLLINLIADDSMKSGNYELGIKMDYKDQRSNAISNEASFFINVLGGSKSSNVELQNVTVMPQEVKANENFMLSFDAYNGGKSAVRNIKFTIKGDEGIVSKSPDVRIIEELAAGEQKKLEYILYAGSDTKTQNYNIQISMEYEDSDTDNKHTVNQYAGVYVKGGNSKITPKIIISNYNFEPKLVRAGEEFSMDLTFMNTSMSKEVKNIKIYLTGIDSDKEGNIVFTPVGSSNTFFIDSIKPKGSAAESITMYTIPDAQPKYYNITANIEYQDEDGTEYKAAELVGIPVIQQSKLDASEISLPPEMFIGQPSPISLQYYNKGKTKLSNLMIKVEGDFQMENGQAFVGNFESGSSDYFEAMITATKPGPAAGKVIFSYEDPSGEETIYEREFTINAIEMPPMENPGDMPPAPISTKDKLLNNTVKNKFFWAGVVVVAAAAFTARRLILKKRRKGMELDE